MLFTNGQKGAQGLPGSGGTSIAYVKEFRSGDTVDLTAHEPKVGAD